LPAYSTLPIAGTLLIAIILYLFQAAPVSANPSFPILINFQPDGAPIPAGYLVDRGTVFGAQGNGYSYGWNNRNNSARDRNAANSPDQRYDTLVHMQSSALPNATWAIALPNGQYRVRVVAGDPSYFDSVYKINAEGTLAVNGRATSSSRWVEGTVTVTVGDGRLTVSNATGSSNNKINFIEISAAGAAATATSIPQPTATSVTQPTATSVAQPTPTAGAASPMSRIQYNGRNWYLHGVNAAWWNFSRDFGGGPTNGGLSDTLLTSSGTLDTNNTVVQRLAQLPAANVHYVKWWMLASDPDDAPNGPYQILRDSTGRPTGLDPKVYQDIDAALVAAQQYNLYYEFALFVRPNYLPASWLTTHRTDLINVLRPLFARYANNPRVMTYSIFVEPDWDIWEGNADLNLSRAFVQAMTTAIHNESNALVTVNAAMVDGLPNWKGLGLDFYSASWYDYMNSNDPLTHNGGGGKWCALCTTATEIRTRYALDKPVVIGEFYAGDGANYIMPGSNGGPLERNAAWYNKGFAGALAWSLFPERTETPMPINFTFYSLFGNSHGDIGPR
jgi:hypothetical protein